MIIVLMVLLALIIAEAIAAVIWVAFSQKKREPIPEDLARLAEAGKATRYPSSSE